MSTNFDIQVEPKVLKWARAEIELSVDDAALKLKISPETLTKWEAEESGIKLSKLKQMSKVYSRPLALFLLSEPPKSPKKPKDHRTIGSGIPGKSKQLLLAIKHAYRLREIFVDTLGEKTNADPLVNKYNFKSSNPLKLAEKVREEFGITEKIQFGWKDETEALNTLIALLEARGLLVFQFTFKPSDARGFTLPVQDPPVIVMSSSDSIRARLFTLMHEYCHLLVGETGISDLNNKSPLERFCNQFASEFLMPKKLLLNHISLQSIEDPHTELKTVLNNLQKDFKVSDEALLTKLYEMKIVTRLVYEREKERIEKGVKEFLKKKTTGGPAPAVKCLSQNGLPYVTAVLSASRDGRIDKAKMSEFLNIKQRHLSTLERNTRRKGMAYESIAV